MSTSQKVVIDNATGAEGQSGAGPNVSYTVTATGQVTAIGVFGAGGISDVATAIATATSTSPTSVVPTSWKSGNTTIPFTPAAGVIICVELWGIVTGNAASTQVDLSINKGATVLGTASVVFTSTPTNTNSQYIRACYVCPSTTTMSGNPKFIGCIVGSTPLPNGFAGTSQPVTVSAAKENFDITAAWSGAGVKGTWTTVACIYSVAQI